MHLRSRSQHIMHATLHHFCHYIAVPTFRHPVSISCIKSHTIIPHPYQFQLFSRLLHIKWHILYYYQLHPVVRAPNTSILCSHSNYSLLFLCTATTAGRDEGRKRRRPSDRRRHLAFTETGTRGQTKTQKSSGSASLSTALPVRERFSKLGGLLFNVPKETRTDVPEHERRQGPSPLARLCQ